MDAGVGLFTTDVPDTLRLVGTLGLSSPDALYAFVVDFGEEQAYLGMKWYYGLGLLANGLFHLSYRCTVSSHSSRNGCTHHGGAHQHYPRVA